MKAICLEDYGKVAIREVKAPVLKRGNAIIKIVSATVCGSDINAYKKKGTPVNCPLILGHEVAGIVEEIGEEDARAHGLKIGDRVVLDPYMACRHCYPCSLGHTNCCESLHVLGVQIDGAMCEYVSHPVDMLIQIDDAIPWDIAPIAEPLTIALHAIHKVQPKQGEKLCICGAGPIGILAAMAAQNVYDAIPIMIDVIDSRLAFSKKVGVVHTINPAKCDPIEEIAQITNGRMSETLIEASGANASIRSSLDYVSYCGRIALTGWPSKETSLPTDLITRKEISIFGSRCSAGEFAEAVRLIRDGLVDARAILTQVVTFADMPKAIEKMAAEPENFLKIGYVM